VVNETMPIEADEVGALVVGTSKSLYGYTLETEAKSWARQRKIPIVAVEDYAGNCALGARDDHGQWVDPDYIIAESDFSRRCYMRAGFPVGRIIVLPPIRYDVYREAPPMPFPRRDRLRGILWAGQPECGMGQAALGWLTPWIRRHGLKVYFRAHPRDLAYVDGFWHEWFGRRRLRWVDCTQWPWPNVWTAPLGLVATAFSSVAVEAAFQGLPTLHVLHPLPVRKLLIEQKRVARPGVVATGVAFASSGPLGFAQLDRSLEAASLRRAGAQFDRIYRGSGPVIDSLKRVLEDIIVGRWKTPIPR
jgi:hypothetical protein